MDLIVHNTMPRTSKTGKGGTGPLSRTDGKTYCLNIGIQKDNLVMQINPSLESGGKQPYQQNRVYDVDGISPALCAFKSDLIISNLPKDNLIMLNERQRANFKSGDEKANSFLSTSWKGSQANGMTLVNEARIRRLTPIECERLQTVKDNVTKFCMSIDYLYICNETNVIKKWLQSAELKSAIQISQAKRQDYATNIIYDLKELEQLKERLLIEQKNANTKNATILNKLLKDIVLLTTKDLSNTAHQKSLSKLFKEIKNVNIVIKPLEKMEEGQEGCVIDITKTGLDTTTLYMQIINAMKLSQEDIMVELMVKSDTGLVWKIQSEKTLNMAKLYIILILIKQIIQSKIYTYSKIKVNIKSVISNLNISEQNYLNVELLDLRMENISLNSDSQRYKMLGNGWTVDVIAHILTYVQMV